MKDTQYKLLNTGAFLFAGIVFLVMIFQYFVGPKYKVSNAEMLEQVENQQRWVMPADLLSLVESNCLQDYLLVDLRNEKEYNRGTMPGAVNISFDKLLDSESLKQLRGGKDIILFSGTESQASLASLLLAGKGFKNVLVMANDFSFIKESVLEKYKSSNAFTHSEKAQYDYPRFFKTSPIEAKQSNASKPKIIETKMIVSGGC